MLFDDRFEVLAFPTEDVSELLGSAAEVSGVAGVAAGVFLVRRLLFNALGFSLQNKKIKK